MLQLWGVARWIAGVPNSDDLDMLVQLLPQEPIVRDARNRAIHSGTANNNRLNWRSRPRDFEVVRQTRDPS